MIIRAPRPEGRFYVLDKRISEDSRLSWGARGLLVFLLGKPDNWQVSPTALVNEVANSGKPTGRDATYALISELIDAGYVWRKQGRKADGTHDATNYFVSEAPHTDLPDTAQPDTAQPHPVNPTQTNTDLKQGLITEQGLRQVAEKRVRQKKVARANAEFSDDGRVTLHVDDGLLDDWMKAFPAVDVRAEVARAQMWLQANPSNRKSNYESFLFKWMTRAQDRAPVRSSSLATQQIAGRMPPPPAFGSTGRRPVHESWFSNTQTHQEVQPHVIDI